MDFKIRVSDRQDLRSIRPRPHDHWQLDEMVVSKGGQGIVTLAEHNRI